MKRTSSPPSVQLDHVVLEVRDVKASLDFYQRIIGLAPVRVDEFFAGEVSFASLRVSRTTVIDLFPRPMWRTGRPSNPNHFCLTFDVNEFRKLVRRLKG